MFHQLSAVAVHEQIQSGQVSAVEVTQAALARISTLNPKLNAFLYVDAEGALAAAAEVDRLRAAGQTLGPLAGVPIAIKDNLCQRGTPTTCASKMLEGWIALYDADVIERLRAAGAVMLGKVNMDEFAMGSSNENSAFGPVQNPWMEGRAPGGSSGGSAAAVAAGLAPLALGSDTGGSVRQPASFCGVVALKPTYGRVSRYGLIAFASSLDQIGPFARDARDCARLMSTISGHDTRDATSTFQDVPDYEAMLGRDIKGLKIGVERSSLDQCASDVRAAMQAALAQYETLGASIVDIELPSTEHAVSAYYIVAPAECSSNLARFDGMRYGTRIEEGDLNETYGATRARLFGPEVKRRIMLGTYVLSAGYYDAYYAKAQKARTLMSREYAAAFQQCDVVLSPTAPTVAFPLGAKTSDPLEMYLADIFTLPPSLAGLPAISVPAGMSEGLPIGMQLTAPAFREDLLLQFAHAYEQATEWKSQHPAMFG